MLVILYDEKVEFIYVLLFLFGTVIGSFLNVVVYRLGTGERMGNARSRCFSCGATLGFFELIPIASFLFQKGKCRHCGSRISWQYPIVEFITGLVFLLTWLRFLQHESGIMNYEVWDGIALLFLLVIFSLLIALSVYDFRHKIIPNQLVYPFVLLALFGILIIENWNLIGNWKLPPLASLAFGGEIENSAPTGVIISHLFAGFAAFVFFGGLWFVSRGRWMGFGDAKLALGMGFLLGPLLTTLAGMLAFWIGAIVSVPIVFLRGGGMKTQIPFGPFLACATFITWLCGNTMLAWYFSLFA